MRVVGVARKPHVLRGVVRSAARPASPLIAQHRELLLAGHLQLLCV